MRKVTLTIGLASLVAMSAIGCGAATSSQDESSVTKKAAPIADVNSITAEKLMSSVHKFDEHQTVKALVKHARGVDPREYELSPEQCRIILADYAAVLKKAPMPIYMTEEFKDYLEESRDVYALACKGFTGSVLDSQVSDAVKAQNAWVETCREEFGIVNLVNLKEAEFPFGEDPEAGE